MTISRSRRLRESRGPSSYRPHSLIATVIGRFRARVRNSPIGATPGGIIAAS
jgi:hypothetical protein